MRDSYGGYRARLIEQLRSNGISDLAVLRAFGETQRHLFVPDALRHRAYEDVSLPIGMGQTISQPTTQARFLQALAFKGDESVLEIGTGSGYQTALLTHLVEQVLSIERIPDLARAARRALQAAGIHAATVMIGDGTLGWKPLAPYDAILVSAVSPSVPAPLPAQLADGGCLIIPIQDGERQELRRLVRNGNDIVHHSMGAATFVPLIGVHGYGDQTAP